MNKILALFSLALATVVPLHAVITITAEEIGSNVVISYTGSVNTAGLSLGATASNSLNGFNGTYRSTGGVYFLNGSTQNRYSGVTGSGAVGTINGFTAANSRSGDEFAILMNDGELRVLSSYVSGTSISGSLTFNSQSFSSLNINEGTNVAIWNWGSGGNADSATFSTVSAVPEPATYAAILGLGAIGLACFQKRSRRQAISRDRSHGN